MKELPKVYDPHEVEKKIYDMWLKGNYFHAERDPEKKPFTIVIPPPNVTGQLHLGHAFDETIQDILIRYKRMDGYSALWLPGYDHAGIATQIKVEEKLRNEGKTRFDLGREGFLDEVWAWKNKFGNRIVEQLKTLGSSCDWERQRFTMDDTCAKAVRETFVNMYEKGLIYKGHRIINWCPHCTTALSDAEVEYVEKPGHLWHVRYPLSDGSGELIIATTRPETMLGDTGVAVNPNDERYKDIVGKTCILPLVGREIPIVADEYVEMDFGTGCVKMTPCHDPNDFEVAQRLARGDTYPRRERQDYQRRQVQRHGPLRVPRGHSRRPGARGLPRQGRGVQPQRRHLLPLPQRRRAHEQRAVVRQDGAPGQGGHPRRRGRRDKVCA